MKKKIYERYSNIKCDKNGNLESIEFCPPENFNFAYDCVDLLAAEQPDRRAMLHISENKEERTFTFSDMSRYSNMTANFFLSLGIKRGDKVMLILKRHYQFWFCILALHKIGAIAIPATNQLKEKDIVYRFSKASVKACVCTATGDISDCVLSASGKCDSLKSLIICNGKKEGFIDFDTEILKFSDKLPRQETSAKDIMLMYFTSGTSGYPKIVCHNFLYPLGHIVTAKFWHNIDPDGLHLTISETGWAKAMWGKLYGQWLCEGGIFVYDFDRFHAEDILPMFKKYNITTFCAPPTMYRFFIKEDLSKYDLSSVKCSTIAGEALNPEVFNKWKEHTGLSLMEAFGQTELTAVIANLKGVVPKVGSMGKPNPQYDVFLMGADGKETASGVSGEIVINTQKGVPCGMFCGYYEDDEKLKSVWYDNVYHTGDIAWRDEDGYFWYVGRTDDLIKSSGYRIGPFEIESVLMELPYILECAVTAVPDPLRGQAVKATIVLKDKEPSDELKKEIQEYVKKQTAPYKYPRVIEFVSSLPKTISGKIRRTEIREKDKKTAREG